MKTVRCSGRCRNNATGTLDKAITPDGIYNVKNLEARLVQSAQP